MQSAETEHDGSGKTEHRWKQTKVYCYVCRYRPDSEEAEDIMSEKYKRTNDGRILHYIKEDGLHLLSILSLCASHNVKF